MEIRWKHKKRTVAAAYDDNVHGKMSERSGKWRHQEPEKEDAHSGERGHRKIAKTTRK